MSRGQFAVTLAVVAVAGLVGGALSDWLRAGPAEAQATRETTRSESVTVEVPQTPTEEGFEGNLRDRYRLRPRDLAIAAREFQLVDRTGTVQAALRINEGRPCLSMAGGSEEGLCYDLVIAGDDRVHRVDAREYDDAYLAINTVKPHDVPRPRPGRGLLAGDAAVTWVIEADDRVVAMP